MQRFENLKIYNVASTSLSFLIRFILSRLKDETEGHVVVPFGSTSWFTEVLAYKLYIFYAGSCSKSMNSTVAASILKTTLSILAIKELYPIKEMIPTKRPKAVVIKA